MKCKYYQRKDSRGVRFVVYLYHSGKKWTRTWDDQGMPIDTLARAIRICEQINADIERMGKAFNPRKWFGYAADEFQFSAYAGKWLTNSLSRYVPQTHRDIRRYINTAIAHFGKMDLRSIKQAHIKEYLRSLPSHLSPASKTTYLAFLKTLLRDAEIDYEDVVKRPHFPAVEIPKKEVAWTTREWQEKIIGAIPEHDRPIFRFLASWPNRPSEVRALKWDCVYKDKGIILIKRIFEGTGISHLVERTKTKRVKYMPITEEIAGILESVKENRLRGFVFVDKNGKPYTAHISEAWNRAREAVGCPDRVNLYQGTKHSFITQHLDQLALASKAAGHTSVQTTEKFYQGANVEGLRKLERK